MEQKPESRLIAHDCGSYAALRLTKGPDGMRVLGTEKIVIYDDGQPFSFFFQEYTLDGPGICGGIILHGAEDLPKAQYSVHT